MDVLYAILSTMLVGNSLSYASWADVNRIDVHIFNMRLVCKSFHEASSQIGASLEQI